MNITKHFTVLITVLALSAIGAANASAAEFTSTVNGPLNGTATATQVFTVNGGTVECTGLYTTGTVVSGAQTSQEATVHYTGCKAFTSSVDISPATYDFTVDGTVHLTNTITITVTNIFGECTVTVPAQEIGSAEAPAVTFSNTTSPAGGISLTPHATGITYHEAGGFPCGSGSFTNGTYTGDSHVFVAGGYLRFDSTSTPMGEFTSTKSASLSATATTKQVLTTNAGTVECSSLELTGNFAGGPLDSLEATVHYSKCTALSSSAHITPATYEFTGNGTVHLEGDHTITVTNIFGECTIVLTGGQTLAQFAYTTSGGGITLTPHATGIGYHESGGFPCGEGTFSDGTYTGDSHVFVAGGELSFDA